MCHMRHKPYTKLFVQKDGLSESDTPMTNAKILSRSIPSIAPHGPHQRLRYLQPKHQHLHGYL
jgi:hypothetical protein